MLSSSAPALVLAPMDGITDAPMRALQGARGGFSFAVSEFLRVSAEPIPAKVFLRDVPELAQGAVTPTGLPVQVQILGGDPERMAWSALTACRVGATAIDINFGCPAPTVNRHDGGASLLKSPARIRSIVAEVRSAVPSEIPVSAKLRLGWDDIDAIHENAAMAIEGGASWITIHARTRTQGYAPPVYWAPIGQVRRSAGIPVVANGDIWTVDDFYRCQDETGCSHFMIGRSALANPGLAHQISGALGIGNTSPEKCVDRTDWPFLLLDLKHYIEMYDGVQPKRTLKCFKQWLRLASNFGEFAHFESVKRSETVEELLDQLKFIAELISA